MASGGRKRAEVAKQAKPAVFQFTVASGFADETGEWVLG
jgi:hypothetical protein